MKLDDLIVPTAVAIPGMSVRALFEECVAKQVPGLPFRAAGGKITGKASIRHVLKMNCIPDYMVKHAALLGNELTGLNIEAEKARLMLAQPVDGFVLPDMAIVGRGAAVAKALAVMERHDTTYLFVVDDDTYHGCISIMSLAQTIIRHAGP